MPIRLNVVRAAPELKTFGNARKTNVAATQMP
jgi:hypothetical protein